MTAANNSKKLGKGLDDISYLFLSPSENSASAAPMDAKPQQTALSSAGVPLKTICIIGNGPGSQNAFLVVNLALALARLGTRIAVVDMDEELPCLGFFLGDAQKKAQADMAQRLTHDGPLGVKFIGLNRNIARRAGDEAGVKQIISSLNAVEKDVDVILVSISRENMIPLRHMLAQAAREFLLLVSAENRGRLAAYAVTKMLFQESPLAKIGIVVTNIAHLYEVEQTYEKIAQAAKKFLDKELYKYGFLFKLKQETGAQPQIASFYDADLTACISNIAQIVILRSSVNAPAAGKGSFFEKALLELKQ